jgi:hypothetical protein
MKEISCEKLSVAKTGEKKPYEGKRDQRKLRTYRQASMENSEPICSETISHLCLALGSMMHSSSFRSVDAFQGPGMMTVRRTWRQQVRIRSGRSVDSVVNREDRRW